MAAMNPAKKKRRRPEGKLTPHEEWGAHKPYDARPVKVQAQPKTSTKPAEK